MILTIEGLCRGSGKIFIALNAKLSNSSHFFSMESFISGSGEKVISAIYPYIDKNQEFSTCGFEFTHIVVLPQISKSISLAFC